MPIYDDHINTSELLTSPYKVMYTWMNVHNCQDDNPKFRAQTGHSRKINNHLLLLLLHHSPAVIFLAKHGQIKKQIVRMKSRHPYI